MHYLSLRNPHISLPSTADVTPYRRKIKQQKQSTRIPKQQDTAETINEIIEKRKK